MTTQDRAAKIREAAAKAVHEALVGNPRHDEARKVAAAAIRNLPLTPEPALADSDPPCTCCGGTGVTYQTERRCACQPALTPADALAVPEIAAIISDALKEAYRIGFDNSAEGWNGEYPGINYEKDNYWIQRRDKAIAESSLARLTGEGE